MEMVRMADLDVFCSFMVFRSRFSYPCPCVGVSHEIRDRIDRNSFECDRQTDSLSPQQVSWSITSADTAPRLVLHDLSQNHPIR
jgi:hypothetical protein